MERLTDRRTAEAVRENIEGLIAAGVEPSVSDVRYVKLAEYEDKEEEENDCYEAIMKKLEELK